MHMFKYNDIYDKYLIISLAGIKHFYKHSVFLEALFIHVIFQQRDSCVSRQNPIF